MFGHLGFWTMALLRYAAKFDPFFPRIAPGWRGSNYAAQCSGAIVLQAQRAKSLRSKNLAIAIWQPWEQADPENAPGDLIVYFYGNPGDYWILDTDYESFSSVYSCNDDTRIEHASILTREIYPSDETVNMS